MFTDYGSARVRAGKIGRYIRAGVTAGAIPTVGGNWTFADGVLAVSHPKPVGLFVRLMGECGPREWVTYPVRLVAPAAAPGKPRRWFGCPTCPRTCTDLFLLAPRPTLGCRKCLGLKYATQFATRDARAYARPFRRL